jgi:histidinol dehydrogenase
MSPSDPLPILDYVRLDAVRRRAALERPAADDRAQIIASVRETVRDVRVRGDAAVLEYAARFDGGAPERLRVPAAQIDAALDALAAEQRSALERAIANVARFHEAQRPAPLDLETVPGVRCERILRPLDSVGLYVPAGSAPLPSALIMSAVPAAIAGVPRRVLCSPARGG